MMPPLLLAFVGLTALLATLGIFYRFADQWTGVLVAFGASMLWGVFALSSQSVVIVSDVDPPVTSSIDALFYMGVVMAALAAVFAFQQLVNALGSESRDAVDAVR